MACAPAAGGSAASARQSARHRLRRAIGVVMGNSRQWWWRSGGLAAEIEAFLARRAAGDAFHDLAPAIHLDDLVEASALLAGLGVEVEVGVTAKSRPVSSLCQLTVRPLGVVSIVSASRFLSASSMYWPIIRPTTPPSRTPIAPPPALSSPIL